MYEISNPVDVKSNYLEVIRNIEKLGNAVKSLYSLEKQVQKEQLESATIRGGNELGMYEV